MAKKDQATNELKKGEQESAVTIAVGRSSRSANVSGSSFKFGKVKYFVIALVLVVTVVNALLFAGNIFNWGSTAKQEITVFVEHIQDLATLATAEAHLKVVKKQEDYKVFGKDFGLEIPGTKREVLFIVPATVIAGVELSGVTSENLNINKEKKQLHITLPHAKLLHEPAILMDELQTYSNEGLLRSELKSDEGIELLKTAQKDAKAEAKKIGLLQTAEQNAEKVLKEFFKNLDYTVEITFK